MWFTSTNIKNEDAVNGDFQKWIRQAQFSYHPLRAEKSFSEIFGSKTWVLLESFKLSLMSSTNMYNNIHWQQQMCSFNPIICILWNVKITFSIKSVTYLQTRRYFCFPQFLSQVCPTVVSKSGLKNKQTNKQTKTKMKKKKPGKNPREKGFLFLSVALYSFCSRFSKQVTPAGNLALFTRVKDTKKVM